MGPHRQTKSIHRVARAIRDRLSSDTWRIITALDQEIPAALFRAVAQVLTYVYQLKNWRGGTPPPKVPDVGDVTGGEPDPPVTRW